MPINISQYSKPFEKDDDFSICQIDNKKKEGLVIICDGVSSSFYGKIAARMISVKSVSFFKKNKQQFLSNPFEAFQKLLSYLQDEFNIFYTFIHAYKKGLASKPYSFLQSQSEESISNLKKKGVEAIKEIKKEGESINEQLKLYNKLLEIDLLPILEKYNNETKDSSSTFAFVYVKEVSETHFLVLSFLLGDFYFIHSFF